MTLQGKGLWMALAIGFSVGRFTGPSVDCKGVEVDPAPINHAADAAARPTPSEVRAIPVSMTTRLETQSTRPRESKPATTSTIGVQEAARNSLDFSDRQDFEDAQRGHIAPLPHDGVVRNAEGNVIWSLRESVVAAVGQECPETVHPSLWRQSQLLGISGLFQVSERIYQVRGMDLANITFIEGDEGLIVIDPLLSVETAKAALDLYYAHRPRVPVVSVIITHSHPDHFGGIAGIVSQEDVDDGTVSIISPKDFLEEVVSESVLAGNVMQRRAGYMYGNLLPKNSTGDVGSGLGLGTSRGTTSLMAPTDIISHTGEVRHVDGLTFEFQLTPGSEAPAEMHLYVRELKALCPAENATHTMHNLYTLRGAKVRDAKSWVNYLQQTIDLFGDRTEVLFAPHHWPLWDQDRIVTHLGLQRDLYKYIHDQTVRMANQGLNMVEAAEQIELPPEIARHWANRGYYGTLNHNVKAVWNYYLGWFDGNPARLHPLPPKESAVKYLELMGGSERVVEQARLAFERGEYRWVCQLLDHVVLAEPSHLPAREMLADALEQLGYQAESSAWRNFYLSGARELREGIRIPETTTTVSTQSMSVLPLSAIFDSLAVRVNSDVARDAAVTVNFTFTDTEEAYTLSLKRGVLNAWKSREDETSDCTVRITRTAFDEMLDGRASFAALLFRGDARLRGQPRRLMDLFRPVEQFEPWFDIMSPPMAIESQTVKGQDAL